MIKAINIISIILLLSVLGVFMYVYAVPWFKGTMVPDNDPHCGMNPDEKCPGGSYCCRDPREGGPECLSIPCDEARLEQPKENQVAFFKVYSMCVIGILIIFAVISIFT
jgi:hypothetical protein